MLRSQKSLEHYTVRAADGDVGSVVDFLFDDEQWTLRYLVVQTGSFLASRRVLISPISFREIDWSTGRFHLALTMDKIKSSPSIDTDKPVSRQHEWDYSGYYGYPYYWGYAGALGVGAFPGLISGGIRNADPPREPQPSGDVHLRSCTEVRGYHLQGRDGSIGHVDDFLVDDETWKLRYLVVDTSNWWFGKKVLVPPSWATGISWPERKVHVALLRQTIKESPAWKPDVTVDRDYEARLYDHYGCPGYWKSASQAEGERPGTGARAS